MTKSSTPTLQGTYLSCLGLIQLIAYWSYYVQFPGLLSSSGIEPVNFSRAAPWLHEATSSFIDQDSLCELLALSGMVLSACIATGICQHALTFALNAAIYGLLVRTGGTFYSFQWDVLLLETTAVTCLTYAPWTQLRPTTTTIRSPIPLRFLLFKLMLMSGIVKLQAHCPTWEQLTALEFHFATQCLPGPLAWYAHQLPPLLLRLGVATTLWMEIPATLLLLTPFGTVRRIGAALQLALQFLIILTGNYNFFNLLTMALCLPVWDGSSDILQTSTRWQQIGSGSFLIWTFFSMFRFETADHRLNIVLQQDSPWIQPETFLPLVPYGTLLVVAMSFLRETPKSISNLFHTLTCCLVIGVVAVPLAQIETTPRKYFLRPMLTRVYRHYAQPYGLVNGYGLFRRMTGVGHSSDGPGWAGVPPSVVARPEIIFEGSRPNGIWQELDLFRWKPGRIDVLPRQMAPHQPRLDWQMWFAALGNINHNPWLIHLIYKLRTGCQPVLELVGAPCNLPGVQKIRAKLYHYDFTRLNTTWSQTIPGVELVPPISIQQPLPQNVWTRTLAGEYLPPVESKDLRDYLQGRGYEDFCRDPKRPCAHLEKSNPWCTIAFILRWLRVHVWIALVALVYWIAKRRKYQAKSGTTKPAVKRRAETIEEKKKKQ